MPVQYRWTRETMWGGWQLEESGRYDLVGLVSSYCSSLRSVMGLFPGGLGCP